MVVDSPQAPARRCDVAITCQYSCFGRLLSAFGKQEHLLWEQLVHRIGIPEAELQHMLHDARLLGLVVPMADGWMVTSFGQRWRGQSRTRALPTHELLHQAALNVPLFKETFHALPDVLNPAQLDAYLLHKLPDINDRDLATIRQRYLEGVYGQISLLEYHTPVESFPQDHSSRSEVKFVQFVNEYNALLEKYPREYLLRYHHVLFADEKKRRR